ncbi:MAG: universal stress protein [Oligoflexales bacterium]
MENSTNILVALELILEIDDKIMHKALDAANKQSANLNVVHVIDAVGEHGMVSPEFLSQDFEERQDDAIKKISELGFQFKVPKENRFVKVGGVKEVMVDLIRSIDASLLVVGNHSRHGFDTWFHWNHTINLVKHIDCDVLAVRVF